MYEALWSFYRVLHFIATDGRRNPAAERSKVAIASSWKFYSMLIAIINLRGLSK
jgi:hypothetical protein